MYLCIYICTWCHKVEDNSTATTTAAAPTSPASQCEECGEENSAVCDVEHFPYTTCRYCRGGACVPGGCHVPSTSLHVSCYGVQAASATSTAPRTTSVLTESAGRCRVSGVAIV